MWRAPLDVEERETVLAQAFDEGVQRPSTRPSRCETSIRRKSPSERNAIEPTRKLPVQPGFDRVRVPEEVEVAVASMISSLIHVSLRAAQFRMTAAKSPFSRISNWPRLTARLSPWDVKRIERNDARGSGENQAISPSSMAMGKTD